LIEVKDINNLFDEVKDIHNLFDDLKS